MTEMCTFSGEYTQVLSLSDPCCQEKLDYAAAEGKTLDGWKQETFIFELKRIPKDFSQACVLQADRNVHFLPRCTPLVKALGDKEGLVNPLHVNALAWMWHPSLLEATAQDSSPVTREPQSIMILSYVQRSREVVIGGLYHNI